MTYRIPLHQPSPNISSLKDAEQQRIFDLLAIQRNMQILSDELAAKEHLDSFIRKDVELTAGSVNYINHLLGKRIRGWLLGKRNANSVIWEDDTDTTVDKTINIALWCSADVTVDLIVW